MIDLNWLYSINRPALMPPSYVFGIVWSILYIMIILSLVFFVRNGIKKTDILAISFFVLQLALNLSWTPVFFGLHQTKIALLIILALVVCVAITSILFYQKSKTAGLLLVPYFLWLLFAMYLNFEIVRLNSFN